MAQNVVPVVVVISPGNPSPGATVLVTVTIQPPTLPGVIDITGSPPGFFSALPSSLKVAVGSTQVQFNAVVSATATGTGTITVDGGLGVKQGSCTVAVA